MNDARSRIGEYLHGVIDPAGVAELSAWIRADAQHADEFIREVFVHAQIGATLRGQSLVRQMQASARPDGTLARLPLRAQKVRAGGYRRLRLVGLAAGLLLAAGVTTALIRHRIEQNRVATVSALVDAKWDGTPLVAGATLTTGSYHLLSGLARVDFSAGSQVIAQGPATFTIDHKHLRLDSGQVVVSCPTKSSRSLVLETDDARIVDLGTEYGVLAVPKVSSRVQVFQGSVQVTEKANPTAGRILAAGQGYEIPSNAAPAVATEFVREGAFELRQRSESHTPDAPWASNMRTLVSDPSLIFCSDFNPLWDGKSLANLARPEDPWFSQLNLAVPLQFVPGRFESDQATYFYKLHQGLRLDIPGRFRSLTFSAWIKPDSEPVWSQRHRGLVMPDGWGAAGEVHWQIKRHGIRLTVFNLDDDDSPSYAANTELLFDGGWHQCVSIIDIDAARNTGTVSHYVDGNIFFQKRMRQVMPDLTLGKCCVGNWVPSPDHLADDRTLGGCMGDLMIWSRALGSAEVKSLYERSSPGQGK